MLFARPTRPFVAALLAALLLPPAVPAQAVLPLAPAFGSVSALLTPPPAVDAKRAALFSSPASAILPDQARPAPSAPLAPAPSAWLAAWTPPGMDWLWNRKSDPSLHLAGWDSLLNVARLGAYAVPLRDDPAERANIIKAAQAVDNATILPGGTFSFNAIVGERTPARGFEEGLMFDQGQIVRGTGGGICLVSTGLYNAALQAGLPITERHGHSGVVSYAAPGCDASVVYGSEDMRFVNTTPQPLIVKTDIGINQVRVSLYGAPPPPGRRVWIKTTSLSWIAAPTLQTLDPSLPPGAPPVVDQKPRAGYHVVVERVWTLRGRITRRETAADESRAPRPKRVRVPVPAAPPALPAASAGSAPALAASAPPASPAPADAKPAPSLPSP